jgi:hypothetical protein
MDASIDGSSGNGSNRTCSSWYHFLDNERSLAEGAYTLSDTVTAEVTPKL